MDREDPVEALDERVGGRTVLHHRGRAAGDELEPVSRERVAAALAGEGRPFPRVLPVARDVQAPEAVGGLASLGHLAHALDRDGALEVPPAVVEAVGVLPVALPRPVFLGPSEEVHLVPAFAARVREELVIDLLRRLGGRADEDLDGVVVDGLEAVGVDRGRQAALGGEHRLHSNVEMRLVRANEDLGPALLELIVVADALEAGGAGPLGGLDLSVDLRRLPEERHAEQGWRGLGVGRVGGQGRGRGHKEEGENGDEGGSGHTTVLLPLFPLPLRERVG